MNALSLTVNAIVTAQSYTSMPQKTQLETYTDHGHEYEQHRNYRRLNHTTNKTDTETPKRTSKHNTNHRNLRQQSNQTQAKQNLFDTNKRRSVNRKVLYDISQQQQQQQEQEQQ